MVTLVIFSTGIVAILQSYLTSLDRIEHLNNRLYASMLLDDRIALIKRNLRAYRALPLDMNRNDLVNLGNRELVLTHDLKIKQVENFQDIFELTMSYQWQEDSRLLTLSRSVYLTDFVSEP